MRLSVIAPVRNEEFFIPLYLESVLGYADEIVLLDGGSTDRTVEIINSYADRSGRIKLLIQAQTGLPYTEDWNEGAARNFLLAQATGDWILQLDADEVLSDRFASAAQQLMEAPGIDIYGFNKVFFWKDTQTVRLSVPQDQHWSGFIHRLWRNNGKVGYEDSPHHCKLLYNNVPFHEAPCVIRNLPGMDLLHYHYALGPRIKFNDNRRGDVGRHNNMGEPDWSYSPQGYPIATVPFPGVHPRVIQDYLARHPATTASAAIPDLDLTGISFDRYQRFRGLADLVNDVSESGLSVLDIGLEDGDFSLFVPRHHVRWLDMKDSLPQTALPFADHSYDVVLLVDVIAVMAAGRREQMIREAVRVARRLAVIATPCAGVLPTERVIHALTGNRYLEPHLKNGLPGLEEVRSMVARLGLDYTEHPNSGLPSWFGMLVANSMLANQEQKTLLNRFFNRNSALPENRYPCYRAIFAIRTDPRKPLN